MEARLDTLASALGIVETDTRQGFERLWTFVRDANSRLAPLVASAPEVLSLGMSLRDVGHTIGALERRVSACESGPPLTVVTGTLQEAIEEAVGDQVSTLVNDFLDGINFFRQLPQPTRARQRLGPSGPPIRAQRLLAIGLGMSVRSPGPVLPLLKPPEDLSSCLSRLS